MGLRERWWGAVILAVVVTASSCSTSVEPGIEPRITDVDQARQIWLDHHPADYRFEVAWATSWLPGTGYDRVRVAGGQVVEATDSAGHALSAYRVTVDSVWSWILTARAAGQLNSAEFDGRGVPLESDWGPWPVDGGVHYSIRNFAVTR